MRYALPVGNDVTMPCPLVLTVCVMRRFALSCVFDLGVI